MQSWHGRRSQDALCYILSGCCRIQYEDSCHTSDSMKLVSLIFVFVVIALTEVYASGPTDMQIAADQLASLSVTNLLNINVKNTKDTLVRHGHHQCLERHTPCNKIRVSYACLLQKLRDLTEGTLSVSGACSNSKLHSMFVRCRFNAATSILLGKYC